MVCSNSRLLLLPFILWTLFLLQACDSARTSSSIDEQDLQQVTRSIINDEGRLSAAELADWLIRDTRDFEIIDLRPADQFAAGHIKHAVNRTPGDSLGEPGLNSPDRHNKLVVVSGDGFRSTQAAVLLRLQGFNAYSLDGGYNEWLRYTTDPDAYASESASQRARHQAVACYFAGDYVAEAGLAVTPPARGFTPPLTAVSPQPAAEEPAESVADPLGLGLGLDVEDTGEQSAEEQEAAEADSDPLGLGLGLDVEEEPEEKKAEKKKKPAGLILGEGC